MKSSYEVRAQRFVEQFFGSIVEDIPNMNSKDFKLYTAYFNHSRSRKVTFKYGLARYAFITSDYVVKIDYSAFGVLCYGGCENEMKAYALAVHDGYEYLFAKISRYNYKGINFYIMPRVEGKTCDEEEDAFEYMTEEEQDWCVNNGLSDLHCNNFKLVNDEPIIFDYASMRGQENNDVEEFLKFEW